VIDYNNQIEKNMRGLSTPKIDGKHQRFQKIPVV